MKFHHNFQLQESTPSSRTYYADHNTIRLDFMEHMLRVALLQDDVPLLPTYTIRPRIPSDPAPGRGLADFPKEGRPKLATEGLPLVSPDISEDAHTVSFSLGDVQIRIEKFNFRMSVSNATGLLFQDRDYLAYNFDHEFGDGSAHYISREPEEQIFGLGDKTGPVNKNGRSYRIAASDAMGFDAASSDPLYKQLPFYICENQNGAYGIYYDTYSNGEMNFGKEINNYYAPFKSFRCEEENLVFYLIFGSVKDIVTQFSRLCGPLLFPPKWTLSYAGSTMAYTDAPNADEQLRSFVTLCEKYHLHPGGFYLSSGYTQIGDKRYVFHWNRDKIPSPTDLSSYFQQHGIEFFPNVKPAFLTSHPLYDQIAARGWFLHYADGTPAIFPFWGDYGSYLDFTNPAAYSFWTECIRQQLVEKGYRNIWNDNNEYDITDKEVYADGFGHPIAAYRIRPLFSFLMTMASLAAQDQSKRTVSVSRCGIGGLGRIATTWTGDNRTSFADFRYNHYMAMTMSLSGFYNFGQDIGGFAGPAPDEELFLRWIQYGIFTPRFVLHSWNPDGSSTMPWLYPHKMPLVKRLFALRDSLIPYLYQEMYRSVCTHEPIIYPVFLQYPKYDTESDAFFFGENILVAPIFDAGADSVTVDLPEGLWYLGGNSLHTHAYSGQVTLPCTTHDLPVFFIKAGSIIPWCTGSFVNAAAEDGTDTTDHFNIANVTFRIYPKEGCHISYDYLLDDGVSWLDDGNHEILKFTVDCTKKPPEVTVHSRHPQEVMIQMMVVEP